MPVPASTKKGGAVLGFPDVCQTPIGAPGPVPIPFPNVGTKTAAPAHKVVKPTLTAPSSMKMSMGAEAGTTKGVIQHQYKQKLNQLHAKMMGLPPGNPNHWHTLIDEYVITVAEYYVKITE